MQNETLLKADLRAVGTLIYLLLVGNSPFKGPKHDANGYVSYTDPLWKKASPEALNFVKRLLQK